MEEEFYDLSSFAVDDAEMEGLSLLDTVRKVKPNILIGEPLISQPRQHELLRSVRLWGSLH